MEQNRFFQWIIYEKNKEVVVFDKVEQEDGINYVCFKNGSRCNEELIASLNSKDLTGKMMAEISDPNNMWTFKEEMVGQQEEKWEKNGDGVDVCVIPFLPGKKKIIPIPPTPSVSKFGTIEKNINTQQIVIQPQAIEEPKKKNIDDPISALLDKAKKIDTDVDLCLTISLPSSQLYEMCKDNFENGDDKVIEYITENIDIKYLKKCLQSAIKEMYENQINKSNK